MAKYVGKIQNDKDMVNKKYVDSGLAGKAASSHSHPFYQVSIPTDYVVTGGPDTISRFGIQETRACKTAFLPPEAITIEYTTDGGITWLDYGATDAQKRELVSCKYSGSFKYGGPSCTVATNKIGLRITLNPTDRYCYVNMAYMWVNVPGHTCNVFTEYSTIGAKTTFIKLNNGKTYNINGWSGGNMLYFPGGTFGGGASQTSNRYAYRFTYLCTSINETYKTAIPTVIDLRLYGTSTWNAPNNFMKLDHIYSWDANQNVTFPKNVTAPNFIGHLSGNADSSTTTSRANISSRNTSDTWIPVFRDGYFDYTLRTMATDVSHTDWPNNQDCLATMSFLSFWSGGYDKNGSSNLYRCSEGLIQAKPVIAYSNGSGTAGTITLSYDASKYNHMRVSYKFNGNEYCSNTFSDVGYVGGYYWVGITHTANNDEYTYARSCLINVNGKTITLQRNRSTGFSKSDNDIYTPGGDNNLYITKVELWK